MLGSAKGLLGQDLAQDAFNLSLWSAEPTIEKPAKHQFFQSSVSTVGSIDGTATRSPCPGQGIREFPETGSPHFSWTDGWSLPILVVHRHCQ